MPDIVFDTCVLSNFALSDSLHIIKNFYGNSSYITDFVSAENLRGILKGYSGLSRVTEAIKEGWLKEITLSGTKEKALFESLSVSLGFGEASSIAVAKTRRYVFACDDRVARRESGLLGVKLTGTMGILVKAVKKKIINAKESDAILNRMVSNGFYSPINSIRDML
jgi:predicted nucleic acid-binding protein